MKYQPDFKTYQRIGKGVREALGFYQYLAFSGHRHTMLGNYHSRLEISVFEDTIEEVEDVIETSKAFLSDEWNFETCQSCLENGSEFAYVNFNYQFKD